MFLIVAFGEHSTLTTLPPIENVDCLSLAARLENIVVDLSRRSSADVSSESLPTPSAKILIYVRDREILEPKLHFVYIGIQITEWLPR